MTKKYYWKNKRTDNEGKPIYLLKSPFGYISQDSIWTKFSDMSDSVTAFTEEEVIKWGYNPESYVKKRLKMTKKFTEEEYQKIVGIANHLLSNRSVIELSTLDGIYFQIQNSSTNEERNKFKELNQELALIALPKSRDWAHDQFVEKEKKYFWTGKATDKDGRYVHISRDYKNRPKLIYSRECNPIGYPFTETEVKAAYLDVDMFEKEEVE